MLGYLTPSKQWNLHRRFKRRWYYSGGFNVCEPENKWNKFNSDYFINYVVIFLKKTKTLTNLHWKVVLPLCLVLAGKLIPLRRHAASALWSTLEEAASVDGASGVGASSWEAPKEISFSLLDELAATAPERPALVFVLRIYTIWYK